QALLRLVEETRAETAGSPDGPYVEFRACGVNSGRWEVETEAGPVVWTIDEILDSAALRAEGRQMHHCVAGYRASVQDGRASIWSMRSTRGHLTRRMTTIRLDGLTRRIVECRGPCNRLPKPAEREMLERWAAENNLLMGD